jgi:hypothetical protein
VGGSGRGELGDLLSDGLVDQDELQGLLGQVAAGDQPLVVLLNEQRPGQAQQRGVVGKIPTTSVRRPISRLTRSSGLVLRSLDQCSRGS